jgi:hypothetical protein
MKFILHNCGIKLTSQGGDAVKGTVETPDGVSAEPLGLAGEGAQAGVDVSVRQANHFVLGVGLG